MIISIIINIVLFISLALVRYQQKLRNKMLSQINLTILEVTVPGCKSIYFYLHPDKDKAAQCEIGNEYSIKELVPDYTDNLSLYSDKTVYIMEEHSENCRIRIIDKTIMPSGDPMIQGVLTRI